MVYILGMKTLNTGLTTNDKANLYIDRWTEKEVGIALIRTQYSLVSIDAKFIQV